MSGTYLKKRPSSVMQEKGLVKFLLLPWHLLQYICSIKLLKVEIMVTLISLGGSFYAQLSEQYYYHSYGSRMLKNTSFVPPDGPFCMTSDLINHYTGDNDSYKLDETFSNHLVTYGTIINTIPSVIVTTILGSLMDKFGRKMGLLLPAVGSVIQAILSIIIVRYNLSPYFFILGSFFNGIFGGFSCTVAASFSYVADVSSPRWRSFRLGLIEAGLAFGGCAGQFLIGFWLQRIKCDYMPPLYFFTACFVFIVAYIIILIPESLSQSERDELQSKHRLKGVRAYIEGFKLYFGKLSFRATWKLYVITISLNILAVNYFGDLFVSTYVLKALPFDFNPFQIGIYQSVRSASQGVANLVVLGILVSLKVGDAWIMLMAIVIHVTCNILVGVSRLPWELYTIAAVKGIEGLAWTGGRGLTSKLIKSEQQGALFSIITSVESVAALLSSIVWPLIFPLTLQHNMKAGMTYVFMAVLGAVLIPLIFSLLFLKKEELASERKVESGLQSSIRAGEGSEEDEPLLGKGRRSINSVGIINSYRSS